VHRSLLTAATLTVCLAGCHDLGFVAPDSTEFVVQAYLYAGEPVKNVTVTGVLPINADSGAVAPPISNASIVLSRGTQRFILTPTAGSPGHYEYDGTDLTVMVGDEFSIEVTVGSRTATATTVVPVAPVGLALSKDTIKVDTTFQPGGPIIIDPRDMGLVIHWSNAARDYYFSVTENLESNPKAIPGLGGNGGTFSLRRTSTPTSADSSFVFGPELGYYGHYRLKLYRVTDDYVDLYRGRNQDSRDLNEPRTNIKGALGIFTAFAASSAYFVVR
jgi:hypothetical protein